MRALRRISVSVSVRFWYDSRDLKTKKHYFCFELCNLIADSESSNQNHTASDLCGGLGDPGGAPRKAPRIVGASRHLSADVSRQRPLHG